MFCCKIEKNPDLFNLLCYFVWIKELFVLLCFFFHLCIWNRRCQHDPYGLHGLGFKVPKFVVFVAFSRDYVSQKNLCRNIQTWLALLHQSSCPYLSIWMRALLHQRTTGTRYPPATQHVFRYPIQCSFENHWVLGNLKISGIPVILGQV